MKGDATTEFGAPSQAPKADERPLDAAELKRQITLWRACQDAFDAAAAAAKGKELAKGPRGGGRELDAIVAHVFDADGSYLRLIGGRFTLAKGQSAAKAMPEQRDVIVEALTASAAGAHRRPSAARRPLLDCSLLRSPLGVARARPRVGDRGPHSPRSR